MILKRFEYLEFLDRYDPLDFLDFPDEDDDRLNLDEMIDTFPED